MDAMAKLRWTECFIMRLLKIFPSDALHKLERDTVPEWAWVKTCVRVFVVCTPVIYALCAFVGWGLNPAEWGIGVRAVGVSLLVLLELLLVGMVLFCHHEMHAWIAQNGIEAVYALKKMAEVPVTEQEMAEFISSLGKEQNS